MWLGRTKTVSPLPPTVYWQEPDWGGGQGAKSLILWWPEFHSWHLEILPIIRTLCVHNSFDNISLITVFGVALGRWGKVWQVYYSPQLLMDKSHWNRNSGEHCIPILSLLKDTITKLRNNKTTDSPTHTQKLSAQLMHSLCTNTENTSFFLDKWKVFVIELAVSISI